MRSSYLWFLALLVSFSSFGALTLTPALLEIAKYFLIDNQMAEYTITCYLVGYAAGQLLYGPIANRFGSRVSIRIGIILAIIGCIGCILSYSVHSFLVLLFSRFIMALGASSGVKMTFTLVGKLFPYKEGARVMGLLGLAFAVSPGLAATVGGFLVGSFNWTGSFYLMIIYGLVLFFTVNLLPEAYPSKDYSALKFKSILNNYALQFKNLRVVTGGLLVGLGSSIAYVFATAAPFIAMGVMQLKPSEFGLYFFIPSLGILVGSLISNHIGKNRLPQQILKFGLLICLCGALLLICSLSMYPEWWGSLFFPVMIIYFGSTFVFGNATALALQNSKDHSNASAVISFINIMSAFLAVFAFGLFKGSQPVMLSLFYAGLIGLGFIWYTILLNYKK